ncbi:MAG: choline dehydrogenase [Gammaproteobacteria bacterium]|jgi:choline dehydrogenase|nr:choline dehydrogenase [Gammaproteobacteria bacterium]
MSSFDYIIIGAGSAGCVMANRLSAQSSNRVLLLEAGGSDWNPFIHMPAGLSRLVQHVGVNWNYHTQPQAQLNQRRLFWPRGKVLGGSSSINAMCYIRGQAEDYDHWQALGNPGWSYADVLPYFLRAEGNTRGSNSYHNDAGPLGVADLRHHNPLSDCFIKAGRQSGHALNDDFNGARQAGFGLYQVTQRDGRRSSTATAYLDPVRERANLSIAIRARVNKLRIVQDRAVAVEYTQRGQQLQAEGGEILLCGGAINSPQLLLLSGIGPSEQLRQHGIDSGHHLPGVGANLQDHLDICVLRCSTQSITYDQINEVAVGLNYWARHSGIGSSNIAEAGAFIASQHSQDLRPDMQMHFVPAQLDDHGRNRLSGHGYTIHSCFLHPASRGHIRLADANPDSDTLIDPAYLSDPHDLVMMREAVRLAREVHSAPAFDDYRGEEIFPGKQARDDAAIDEFIRTKAETIYHPVGTCKMGNDEQAVVDQQLRVRGLQGLRVIDASIMPTLISGNTNAAVIMIAEKIAAEMLAE